MHAANKRYSKCGFACSLKQLKSLHTFLLADSGATIYSRTCHIVSRLRTNYRMNKLPDEDLIQTNHL